MIYEGYDVAIKLSENYYDSFLARIVFKFKDLEEWHWSPYGCNHTFINSTKFRDRFGYPIKHEIIPGDTYIVSVFNRHHQQLFMPEILMVHFNCTKRQMFEIWNVNQSSWYNNKNDLEYDENGKVIR